MLINSHLSVPRNANLFAKIHAFTANAPLLIPVLAIMVMSLIQTIYLSVNPSANTIVFMARVRHPTYALATKVIP